MLMVQETSSVGASVSDRGQRVIWQQSSCPCCKQWLPVAHREANSDSERQLEAAGRLQRIEGDLKEGSHYEACHNARQEGEATQLLRPLILHTHTAMLAAGQKLQSLPMAGLLSWTLRRIPNLHKQAVVISCMAKSSYDMHACLVP